MTQLLEHCSIFKFAMFYRIRNIVFFYEKGFFYNGQFLLYIRVGRFKKGSFCIRSGYDRLKYCLQSCVFHIHHLLKAREILLSSFKKSK